MSVNRKRTRRRLRRDRKRAKQWAFHISVTLGVAILVLAAWLLYHIYFGRLS